MRYRLGSDLPGPGDFSPPDDPPDCCPTCGHVIDSDRPARPGSGKCLECDPKRCALCADHPPRAGSTVCAECADGLCVTCEDAEQVPGLDRCRSCAEAQAESLAADLYQIGIELADAQALVARLTAEAEGTRATRQGILDALAVGAS